MAHPHGAVSSTHTAADRVGGFLTRDHVADARAGAGVGGVSVGVERAGSDAHIDKGRAHQGHTEPVSCVFRAQRLEETLECLLAAYPARVASGAKPATLEIAATRPLRASSDGRAACSNLEHGSDFGAGSRARSS